MKKTVTVCDQCGKAIDGKCYRIQNRVEGSTDLYGEPIDDVSDTHDFCSWPCLSAWVGAKDELLARDADEELRKKQIESEEKRWLRFCSVEYVDDFSQRDSSTRQRKAIYNPPTIILLPVLGLSAPKPGSLVFTADNDLARAWFCSLEVGMRVPELKGKWLPNGPFSENFLGCYRGNLKDVHGNVYYVDESEIDLGNTGAVMQVKLRLDVNYANS